MRSRALLLTVGLLVALPILLAISVRIGPTGTRDLATTWSGVLAAFGFTNEK